MVKRKITMEPEIITFLTTFAVVFLAELGDKTQLATLAIAATSSSRRAVFGGAALALVTITLLTILLCEGLLKIVPYTYIRWGMGLLFIAIGAIILLGR